MGMGGAGVTSPPPRPVGRAVVCLALAIGFARLAHAGVWIETGLPGESVSALAVDPTDANTVYAGTTTGSVFKSTDGAGSWNAVGTGLPASGVRALAINRWSPNVLYAGTSGNGVFTTTNGGASWTAANVGLFGSDVRALAIDPGPFTSNIVYAGTASQGVFKTTDSGGNWTAVNTGLTSMVVTALAVDPSNTGRIYAATLAGGLFRTGNGGGSWLAVNDSVGEEFVPLPSSVQAVVLNPLNPFTIYAGTATGGVFRSFNLGGRNWMPINTGLTSLNVHALAIDPTNADTMYAGTDAGGVFKTALLVSGVTLESADPKYVAWSAIDSGLTDLNVRTLAIDPTNPRTIYAATGGTGVFVLTQLCAAAPQAGCRMPLEPNKSVLTLKDKSNNKQDSLVWKWLKGEATTLADFGDPLSTNGYWLCVYNGAAQLVLGVTAPAGGTCNGKPCWKATGTTGFKYKNKLRTPDGVDSVTLKAGVDGKAQAVVNARGIPFEIPTLPLTLPMRVQLQGQNGNCWEATYSIARKNLPDTFDARAD